MVGLLPGVPGVISLLIVIVVVVALGFLLWKERLYRPMWMLRGALLSLLLLFLGAGTPEAVGYGIIAGLLWEILTALASRSSGK